MKRETQSRDDDRQDSLSTSTSPDKVVDYLKKNVETGDSPLHNQ